MCSACSRTSRPCRRSARRQGNGPSATLASGRAWPLPSADQRMGRFLNRDVEPSQNESTIALSTVPIPGERTEHALERGDACRRCRRGRWLEPGEVRLDVQGEAVHRHAANDSYADSGDLRAVDPDAGTTGRTLGLTLNERGRESASLRDDGRSRWGRGRGVGGRLSGNQRAGPGRGR